MYINQNKYDANSKVVNTVPLYGLFCLLSLLQKSTYILSVKDIIFCLLLYIYIYDYFVCEGLKKRRYIITSHQAQPQQTLPHEGRKEMFYLMTHSTHFIYGYMASDIWLRTILIVRKETCCHHIGYSFRLAARVLLYAPSHRQDSI